MSRSKGQSCCSPWALKNSGSWNHRFSMVHALRLFQCSISLNSHKCWAALLKIWVIQTNKLSRRIETPGFAPSNFRIIAASQALIWRMKNFVLNLFLWWACVLEKLTWRIPLELSLDISWNWKWWRPICPLQQMRLKTPRFPWESLHAPRQLQSPWSLQWSEASKDLDSSTLQPPKNWLLTWNCFPHTRSDMTGWAKDIKGWQKVSANWQIFQTQTWHLKAWECRQSWATATHYSSNRWAVGSWGCLSIEASLAPETNETKGERICA